MNIPKHYQARVLIDLQDHGVVTYVKGPGNAKLRVREAREEV